MFTNVASVFSIHRRLTLIMPELGAASIIHARAPTKGDRKSGRMRPNSHTLRSGTATRVRNQAASPPKTTDSAATLTAMRRVPMSDA